MGHKRTHCLSFLFLLSTCSAGTAGVTKAGAQGKLPGGAASAGSARSGTGSHSLTGAGGGAAASPGVSTGAEPEGAAGQRCDAEKDKRMPTCLRVLKVAMAAALVTKLTRTRVNRCVTVIHCYYYYCWLCSLDKTKGTTFDMSKTNVFKQL